MFDDTTYIAFPNLGIDTFELKRFVTQNLFGKGISIAWYGVIICMAMILACVVISRNAVKKEGFVLDSFLDYFLFAIPLGVVGARAMYVLTNLDYYDSFLKMISVWKGGLAIYGGVLTGMVVVLVAAKIKKNSALRVFDAMAPGVLLAQAIGRWGNFINGEAHGGETSLPWGMMINFEGPFHPTFLYESLITFSGFLIATFLLYRKKKFHGEIFAFYLIWYGIGRTLVEALRTDSLYFGPLKASQCIGVVSALAGVVICIWAAKRFAVSAEKAVPAAAASAEEKTAAAPEKKVEEETPEKPQDEEKGTAPEEKAKTKEPEEENKETEETKNGNPS